MQQHTPALTILAPAPPASDPFAWCPLPNLHQQVTATGQRSEWTHGMMTYVHDIVSLYTDNSGNYITTTNPPPGAYVYDVFSYDLVLTSNSGTDYHHNSYDANKGGEDKEKRNYNQYYDHAQH